MGHVGCPEVQRANHERHGEGVGHDFAREIKPNGAAQKHRSKNCQSLGMKSPNEPVEHPKAPTAHKEVNESTPSRVKSENESGEGNESIEQRELHSRNSAKFAGHIYSRME